MLMPYDHTDSVENTKLHYRPRGPAGAPGWLLSLLNSKANDDGGSTVGSDLNKVSTRQHRFQHTHWSISATQATLDSHTDIDSFSSSVFDDISSNIDSVTSVRDIKTFPFRCLIPVLCAMTIKLNLNLKDVFDVCLSD